MQFAEYKAGRLFCTWHSDRGFTKTRGQQSRPWGGSLLQAFLPEGYPDSVTADYAGA